MPCGPLTVIPCLIAASLCKTSLSPTQIWGKDYQLSLATPVTRYQFTSSVQSLIRNQIAMKRRQSVVDILLPIKSQLQLFVWSESHLSRCLNASSAAHPHTHMHEQTRACARTHAHTHTRTHTLSHIPQFIGPDLLVGKVCEWRVRGKCQTQREGRMHPLLCFEWTSPPHRSQGAPSLLLHPSVSLPLPLFLSVSHLISCFALVSLSAFMFYSIPLSVSIHP